jgi:beta-phosphoglucomutase-like phosphatase (HAD superfamily)
MGSEHAGAIVDIDGVLGDFVTAMSRWTSIHRGVAGLGEPSSYSFAADPCWRRAYRSDGEFATALTMAGESGLYLSEPVLDPGAARVIADLRDRGARVLAVTARSDGDPSVDAVIRRDTAGWLAAHGFVVDGLVFAADKLAVGCDVIIEDSPITIARAVAAGIRAVRVPHPYNTMSGGVAMRAWSADVILGD